MEMTFQVGGPLRPVEVSGEEQARIRVLVARRERPRFGSGLCRCRRGKDLNCSLCDACFGRLPKVLKELFTEDFRSAWPWAIEFLGLMGLEAGDL